MVTNFLRSCQIFSPGRKRKSDEIPVKHQKPRLSFEDWLQKSSEPRVSESLSSPISPSTPTYTPASILKRSKSIITRDTSGLNRSTSMAARNPAGLSRSKSMTARNPSELNRSKSMAARNPSGLTRNTSMAARNPYSLTRSASTAALNPSTLMRKPSMLTRNPSTSRMRSNSLNAIPGQHVEPKGKLLRIDSYSSIDSMDSVQEDLIAIEST